MGRRVGEKASQRCQDRKRDYANTGLSKLKKQTEAFSAKKVCGLPKFGVFRRSLLPDRYLPTLSGKTRRSLMCPAGQPRELTKAGIQPLQGNAGKE